MIRIIFQQPKKTVFNTVAKYFKNLFNNNFNSLNKEYISEYENNLEYLTNSKGHSKLKRNVYPNYGLRKSGSFKNLSDEQIINDEYLKILFRK